MGAGLLKGKKKAPFSDTELNFGGEGTLVGEKKGN